MRAPRAGVIFVLAAGVLACGKTRKTEPPVVWHTRIASACSAAKAQQKPVLVYFYASWDVVSAQVDQKVLVDDEVRSILNHDYVGLRIDRTNWYMRDLSEPIDDDVREAEAAAVKFKP